MSLNIALFYGSYRRDRLGIRLADFLEEWFWRPAAIACYSPGIFGGVRAMTSWRVTLAELGMPTVSSIFPASRIHQALGPDGAPTGEDGARLERNFPKFADDLAGWAEAAKTQRAAKAPPY